MVFRFYLHKFPDFYFQTALIPIQYAQIANVVRKKTFHHFSLDRSKNTWQGTAWIPIDYFPPAVTKFNAYAIHGVEPERRYEALFPVPGPFPDFHRLEHFQPIDFTRLRPDNDSAHFSEVWKNSLAKEKQN